MSEADDTDTTLIRHIANVAYAVGFQSGNPAMEIAGMIVSHLAANPEDIQRFRHEGSELFIDGSIKSESGCLSYRAGNDSIFTPAQLRAIKGAQQ